MVGQRHGAAQRDIGDQRHHVHGDFTGTPTFWVTGCRPRTLLRGGVSTNVTATFSADVNQSTLTSSNVPCDRERTPPSGHALLQRLHQTVTLDPNTDLQAGKTYTATITGGSSGVKDLREHPAQLDDLDIHRRSGGGGQPFR